MTEVKAGELALDFLVKLLTCGGWYASAICLYGTADIPEPTGMDLRAEAERILVSAGRTLPPNIDGPEETTDD